MDRNYFSELLQKYLRGEATREEVKFLESYYNLFDGEQDVLEALPVQDKDALQSEIHGNVWRRIQDKEQAPARVRRMTVLKTVASVAAVVLIAFVTWIFVRPSDRSIAVNAKRANHLITLPDGSTVILKASSKLNYPSSFDGEEKREVYLDGEAFFDVKHNEESEFIVHAGKVNVTVLGTAFDVKAFPVDADITVTVKRGMVRVSDENKTLGTIIPQQQIVYNKANENAVLQLVNSDDYMNWKEQDIAFDNVTVGEAAALLEERFNVEITIKDRFIQSERFTASFPASETLEQALKSICEFNGAVYHYDKKRAAVVITRK
jgi:ferric-dicitrate binding protein FerR (iron transport regulator)